MDLHCAKETQDFTSGYSGPNLPFTQQVELLLALKDGNGSALHQRNLRLCWWFLWSKSLDDATFYAPIDSREVEMDLHCTKETQGFTSGSSGPNLPITQQVKLLLALEDVNGSALRQRILRLCWWFLWSKSPNYATGQAPIGSRGSKWSYIVPKKLETSVVAPLVLISS